MIDPVDQREAKRSKKQTAQRMRDQEVRATVLKVLMSDPKGRRYIWLELEESNVFSLSYVQGSFDLTAFNEGKRLFGNRLLNDVQKLFPEDFIRMVRENAASKPEEPAEQEENEDV